MFDIEQRESAEGQGRDMNAFTSFELEAQRRRETIAADRGDGRRWLRGATNVDGQAARPQSIQPGGPTRGARVAADCHPVAAAR